MLFDYRPFADVDEMDAFIKDQKSRYECIDISDEIACPINEYKD